MAEIITTFLHLFYTELLTKLIECLKTSQQHKIGTFELDLIAVDYVFESY